uniref:TM2 domain-containing protein n=1 Tax=Pyrodinium bahamense TaxID=73915 RepID=A0A7S0FGK0_9DINO
MALSPFLASLLVVQPLSALPQLLEAGGPCPGHDTHTSLLQTAIKHSALVTGPAASTDLKPKAPPAKANGTEVEVELLPTVLEMAAAELEYELDTQKADVPVKNKIILIILELLGLGLCGIDRCYLGQTCAGVLKGITFGGLTVWAMLDYFAVVITCLSMSPSLNAIGMRVDFSKGSITAAFVIVIAGLLVKLCCGGTVRRMRAQQTKDKEAESKTAEPTFTGQA